MQKILKLVKHDVIISHTDFEDVMRACEQIEVTLKLLIVLLIVSGNFWPYPSLSLQEPSKL